MIELTYLIILSEKLSASLDRYALFQLVERRLPDPLNAHQVFDRTIWPAVDDPLAVAGPTPGRVSSSANVAVLRSTSAPAR